MYYVYCDYDEHRIEEFNTEEDAIKLMNTWIGVGAKISDFKLIQGTEIKLKAIEVTTKVVIA